MNPPSPRPLHINTDNPPPSIYKTGNVDLVLATPLLNIATEIDLQKKTEQNKI